MGKKPPMTANEGISCPRNGEGGPKIKVIPRAAPAFLGQLSATTSGDTRRKTTTFSL